MTFGLIVLEFGRKNKKEIIIKLVQQSKALKSIGKLFNRYYWLGAVHKKCRHLRGGGATIFQPILLKNYWHGGEGCQKSGKIADIVYGWSLLWCSQCKPQRWIVWDAFQLTSQDGYKNSDNADCMITVDDCRRLTDRLETKDLEATILQQAVSLPTPSIFYSRDLCIN